MALQQHHHPFLRNDHILRGENSPPAGFPRHTGILRWPTSTTGAGQAPDRRRRSDPSTRSSEPGATSLGFNGRPLPPDRPLHFRDLEGVLVAAAYAPLWLWGRCSASLAHAAIQPKPTAPAPHHPERGELPRGLLGHIAVNTEAWG
ncbi:hypothetical protein ACFQ07_21090 [Actinomadura adrarensis]|uniref:Uncharacterized protein n=1 Tax=Actinomadura adrarensis TaxID=1819600 RepID=A0ABW3CLY3_9ACTN